MSASKGRGSEATDKHAARTFWKVVKSATENLRPALGLEDDQTPFPWQEDLLKRFISGAIPPALDIPTGLGKTAVMTIWLVARSCGAKLPRRLVYVVDRRAVVDQATTEAERLREWVAANANVKEALGLAGPLLISTLRGQHVDNREWLEDPGSPAIIVGTVDMVGSRLLFEGFGVSRKMRPYHAGLLGSDTLLVLDEAHLVPAFERLIESIASGAEFRPSGSNLVPGSYLMSLSATGRTSSSNTHGLTKKDLEHPVIHKRLRASKRLVLKQIGAQNPDGEDQAESDGKHAGDLADALAQEAFNLAVREPGNRRVLVYCDSREMTVKVKSAVEKRSAADKNMGRAKVDIETELFVGGRRVFEREQAWQRLKDLGFLANSKAARLKPTFLFATSAAEVGVDLDADDMVSDLVAWERMVQRLGRVNRRGDGEAAIIVVVEKPKPKKREKDAIEKNNRGDVLDNRERKALDCYKSRLQQVEAYQKPFEQLLQDHRGSVSPGSLLDLKQEANGNLRLKVVVDAAMTPAPLRPSLTRALVDAWSLTSLEKHSGRPAIDPWLRGWIETDPPQTSVVWRTHLPVRSGGPNPTEKEINLFFEAAPPHASEVLETETFRVFEWLGARGKSLLARSNEDDSRPDCEAIVAFVLARDGKLRGKLRLNEIRVSDDKDAENKRKEKWLALLAGATLVVDARLAGLRDGLLEVSESSYPRTADDGLSWLEDAAVGFRVRYAAAGEAFVTDPVWRERLRFAAEIADDGETRSWLIVEKWRHDAATEEDRSAGRLQLLEEHQSWAERRGRELAKRLGLPTEYEETLAAAAVLHDEGKRAKRWQRAFSAPAGGPYAKTEGPISYAMLDGYRHELASLSCAAKDERLKRLPDDLQDLVLHLIATHHGFGRPLIGTSGCEDAPPSVVEERAKEVALRFARLQRRWGPWGLAWWESLLRAADQQASRDNDAVESGTKGGAS